MPREPKTRDERFIEITTNGRKILPPREKYVGLVRKLQNGAAWQCLIEGDGGYRHSKIFKKRELAENDWREKNESDCMALNIIYEYENAYYCVMSNETMLMKFSHIDIELVNAHIWRVRFNNKYQAITKRQMTLASILFPSNSYRYKKNDLLDNTRENIQIVEQGVGCVNLADKIRSDNKSGIKGVFFKESTNSWYSKWVDDDGNHVVKSFNIATHGGYDNAKELAIQAREDGILKVRKYNVMK